MSLDLEKQIQELQAENQKLRQQLEQKSKVAARALASYQQRALHMEIIRQQNAELDRLTAGLAQAKGLAEERAGESEEVARQYSLANLALEKEIADRKQAEVTLAKRVRELHCLNEISREIAEAPGVADLFSWIAERVPLAMQYPDLCKVAIEFDNQVYGASEAVTLPAQVVNALWIEGKVAGRIYIAYWEKHDFLDEESAMLGGIASRVSAYVENLRLVEQLQQRATELEEASTMLDSFVENTPVMIFVKEAKDLKFVRWNKASERLLGFNRQDVLGKGDHDFLPKEVADFFNAKDREVLATGQTLDIPEEPIQTGTGEIRYLHTQKVPIYGADGEPKYLMGVSEDITERKRAEASLRESEQRYRQILDAITDMVLVKGPQSRIVWANKAFRDCYGMTNEELSNLIDAPFVEPDYTQQYVKDDAYVFETGRVLNIPEEPVARYDGQILTVHTVKSPIFDAEGNVEMTVGVSRDMSERKQAETALAKRAAELQTVAQVGVVTSTILEVNNLLQQVVDLTKSSFNLYHAHIYLLNEAGDTLYLAAGAGDVGRQMVAQGWSIPLDHPHSLVAQTAQTKQGVIVNNVRLNPDFLPNPLLPDTRSEMAVPMMVRNKVVGVLDVQSDVVDRFTEEDVRIKTILAAQVAVALQNAQQYEQAEAALAEVEHLYEASTQIIQASTVDEVLQALVYHSAFQRLDRVTLLFFDKPWSQERPEFMSPVALWEKDNEYSVVAPNTRYSLEKFPVISFFSRDEPTILTDILADKRTDPNTRAFLVDELGVRSLIVFPLVVSGQWLGVITAQGYTTLNLNETEIRQLKSLVDQAATVTQTLRLFSQTQQSLTLTERLFEAGHRLNIATDLNAAVKAIVESVPLAEINRAVLMMFESNTAGDLEAAVIVANWYSGVGTLPTPIGTRYPWQIMGTLQFALTTEPIFFNDTSTDPRVDPNALQVFERQNIRAMAVLPLWVGSRQLGVLLLEAEDIYLFTRDEIEPYTALAGQLAIVIDRQRLLDQTQAALAETGILYQTAQDLTVASSLDEILQAIALAEITTDPTAVSLSTLEMDENGQPEWSTLAANWASESSGPSASVPVGTRFYLPDFSLSKLWMTNPDRVVLIGNTSDDEKVDPLLQQILQQGNVAAMVLMPLAVRANWIGLVTVTWSTPQTFTERHQRLFNSLALQVAGAVNNQLLLDRSQASLAEQERLTVDLDNQRSTLQTILESIPVGVFVVDASTGKPILSNRQAQEILGRGIAPDADKEALAEVYAVYRHGTDELYPTNEMPLVRGMSGEIATIEDMEIRRPDGQRVLLQVFGAPIRDATEQIIASVAIFQDISEQRQTAQEREALLAEVQAAYRQFVQREWQQFLREKHGGHWHVEHQQHETPSEVNGKIRELQDEVTQAGKLKAISANDQVYEAQPAIVAPIALRGQIIGTLSLQDIDPDRKWTAEEIALVETVSEQLAQTVENLRLFEDTQKRATREQLTRQITDKMRALPDMDSIIKTGLAELAQALGASRTYVKLTSKSGPVEDKSHEEIDALRAQLKQHGQQKP